MDKGLRFKLIEEYMQKEKISKNEFAKRSGLTWYMVNKIIKCEKRVNIIYVIKLAKFLNIRIDELINNLF